MNRPAPLPEVPLETIHAAHRQAKIVIAAIGTSLISYAVVVEILRRAQPDAAPVAGSGTLRMVFFAIAVIGIFAATVTKGILLRTAPPTPEGRLARLRTTSVLSAGFAELPAVVGLVLFLTTRQRTDFYALLVVAAYVLVRHFPRLETWENYVRRGMDAR